MAYGKIKADTFVYDNSGSDVEVTLASLGNKVDAANPTFTGTVTIPTPSSGDNSTKAASTAFVVAGFTGKPASAGTVAASEVVQVDANKDTTGIRNLTISGNLQVNGTTTTVASSTMTVTDKNIEIAKGAANDAAADGAGITIDSGDGDKTWNWVDATDAWTSSEHIHLLDDKRLKVGTGQDLVIYHNSGNSWNYIQSGSSNNIAIQAKAGENSITCYPDSYVGLYYDSDKTFETVQDGIKSIGREGQSAYIYMHADEGDDNADKWVHQAGADGTYYLKSYSTGSWVTAFAVDGSGNVSDAKGDVRTIPQNTQAGSYQLTTSDVGKHILAGATVIIPNSTFAAGDAVTIVNNTSGNITITASIGTLYNTADAATGNRTLAARGMATILFASATVGYISGAGLS